MAQTVDITDVWHRIRNHRDAPLDEQSANSAADERFLVISPTIGSRPLTGLIGGLNGNVAFFRGDSDTTRISSLSGGFRFSEKKQVLSGVRFSVFTEDDRWFLQGDNRLQLTSQDTYGLGGDSTWQQLSFDVRTYKNVSSGGRHRVAFWLMGDLVTGGTAPYLDLPASGSDGRSARGYVEGRYLGQHLVYGEVEYRGSLTSSGLLGFVAFLNTTTVDSTGMGKKLFDAYAPAAGFGFRVLLNKRSRTNLATDFGWGKGGSRGFYLGLQEAF